MAKRRAKGRRRRMQHDLFGGGRLFPVRRRESTPRAVDLTLRIKSAMGRALKECPDSIDVVAAKVSELTGRRLSADALYAYTAPSKRDHVIDAARLMAFTRATGANWLWDELLADEGLIVLEGEQARLAELGALRQEQQRLNAAVRAAEKALNAAPVKIKKRSR